jgi:hypothetical protein
MALLDKHAPPPKDKSGRGRSRSTMFESELQYRFGRKDKQLVMDSLKSSACRVKLFHFKWFKNISPDELIDLVRRNKTLTFISVFVFDWSYDELHQFITACNIHPTLERLHLIGWGVVKDEQGKSVRLCEHPGGNRSQDYTFRPDLLPKFNDLLCPLLVNDNLTEVFLMYFNPTRSNQDVWLKHPTGSTRMPGE